MASLEGGAVAKAEIKVAFMVVLMVLTFLISWLPYTSLAMLVVYNPDVEIHPLVGSLPSLPSQEQYCVQSYHLHLLQQTGTLAPLTDNNRISSVVINCLQGGQKELSNILLFQDASTI